MKVSPKKKKQFYKIIIIIISFFLSFSQAFATIDKETLIYYSLNNILYYDPTGNQNNCKPSNSGIYEGTKYNFTDNQLRGLLAVAEQENGASLNSIKTELSIMANLYEYKTSEPYTTDNFIDYIINGGWFAPASTSKYSESFSPTFEDELKSAKEILNEGKRTLPKEILEHDYFGDIKWISNDGGNTKITDQSEIQNRSNYKQNQTQILALGDIYIFYSWADQEKETGDPFGYFPSNPPTSSSSSTSNVSNTNYKSDKVWSDDELKKIEENRHVYENSANKYHFPWQVMAVLHSMETGLVRYNPDNGQGVYQLYSYTDGGTNKNRFTPASSISEQEFQRQTDIAAKVASEMAGDLNNPDNVKSLFFQYNGKASPYIEKAKKMGFSDEEANNGEGSAYVMNRYDARRDPTSSSMDSNWPGRYVADGVYDPSSTTEIFGAFVKYTAIGGAGSAICSTDGGDFSELVLKYAWPEYHPAPFTTRKEDYIQVIKKRQGEGKYVGGYDGVDCGGWVTTLLQESGFEPDYNDTKGGTDTQENWVKNHGWKLLNTGGSAIDPATLKPGDVAFVPGHTWIYVGEIEGFNSKIASASYGERAPMAGQEPYNYEGARWYRKGK